MNMSVQVQELKVNVTSDLNMFKFLKGNRPPNPQHIKKLASSIRKFGMLCNPILVNEKYEIIDGQHRFLAAKEINSPIYYIIVKGYALEQVHALNVNQKNWTGKEYMEGYSSMGIKDYKVLKKFSQEFTWLNLSDCIALLSNITTAGNFRKGKLNKSGSLSNVREVFNEGTWKVRNIEKAKADALRIKLIEPYFKDGYNSSGFVGTMLSMFQNPDYDHNEFIKKIRIQPTALVKCNNRKQYKALIEDIYNFKRRHKINLRF